MDVYHKSIFIRMTHNMCNLEMIRTWEQMSKWEVVIFFWLVWEIMWGCWLQWMFATSMQTLDDIIDVYFGKSDFSFFQIFSMFM